MSEIIRIVLGVVIFYVLYRLLHNISTFVTIPILFLIGIFIFFLFLPDLGNKANFFHRHKNIIVILAVVLGVVLLFIVEFIVAVIAIFTTIIILGLLMKNQKIFHSLPAGLLLSAPLYFVNPMLFVFAFLGFFSFWLAKKVK